MHGIINLTPASPFRRFANRGSAIAKPFAAPRRAARTTPDARLEADLNLLFGERLKIEEELLLVHTHTCTLNLPHDGENLWWARGRAPREKHLNHNLLRGLSHWA